MNSNMGAWPKRTKKAGGAARRGLSLLSGKRTGRSGLSEGHLLVVEFKLNA